MNDVSFEIHFGKIAYVWTNSFRDFYLEIDDRNRDLARVAMYLFHLRKKCQFTIGCGHKLSLISKNRK